MLCSSYFSHRNFPIWNISNYGHYFQLLSCIILSTGSPPPTLKLSRFRKCNCFSCLGGVCVCGVSLILQCYMLSSVQGFGLILFSIGFLRAVQSPLPVWGRSCMLISQFLQNTDRSLPKYLVRVPWRKEVSGLGWLKKAGSGPVAVSCFFSALGEEDSFPETKLWCC